MQTTRSRTQAPPSHRHTIGQPPIADSHSQLSLSWFKSDMHAIRRASSSAISTNSTTDIDENGSDHDSSSQDISTSPSPSNQSSRTASPSGGITPASTPQSGKRSRTSALRLSLSRLRTHKSSSSPQVALTDPGLGSSTSSTGVHAGHGSHNTSRSGHPLHPLHPLHHHHLHSPDPPRPRTSIDGGPRSAFERRLSLDQQSFLEGRRAAVAAAAAASTSTSTSVTGTTAFDPPPPTDLRKRRDRTFSFTSTLQFSTSAPKSSSSPFRLSMLYSPAPLSPSTTSSGWGSRSSHQRCNTTPSQPIAGPSSFGTSPRRSAISPSPQPVKETRTIMTAKDPATGNKMINKYMIVRELGRGVHGKVKLCRDTETNELCAIKIVDKTTRRRLGRSQLSNEQKIRREVAIMKKCIHPHVVRLIEVIDDPTARKIYLVLEYMEGGDIKWKDAEDQPILPLQDARTIFRDVVLGLEYLHMQGIIHRDIKPANLLLSNDGSVKISDFGVSHFSEKNSRDPDGEAAASAVGTPSTPQTIVEKGFHVPTTATAAASLTASSLSSPVTSSFSKGHGPLDHAPPQHRQQLSSTGATSAAAQQQQWGDDLELAKTAGSPAFFAPELCYASEFSPALSPAQTSSSQTSFVVSPPTPRTHSGIFHSTLGSMRPPITKAIDIWALGVTLYCLVYGRCPFIAETEFELFNIIPRKQAVFLDSVPGRDYVDPELKDLLSKLLEKDVYKRITLNEVKEHPWVIADLPDPVKWRIETDPGNYQRVHVTEEEVKSAVTIIDKIKNRIRKLSVSLSNFTLNRRRSKSISSAYSPHSPTIDVGPVPIVRSPSATPAHYSAYGSSYQQQSPHPGFMANPVSLPERSHPFHSYNGAASCSNNPSSSSSNQHNHNGANSASNHGGLGGAGPMPMISHGFSGRLERPNSVCSNTSSIDEVDEGDEQSGQSGGSGSSAHNNTSYIGRRRLFQHHHHPHHHHHPPPGSSLGYGYGGQYSQSNGSGFPQRPPSIGSYSAMVSSMSSRRTYSDDQLDQTMAGGGAGAVGDIGPSIPSGRSGSFSAGSHRPMGLAGTGHSGLSKSWVYASGEQSGDFSSDSPASSSTPPPLQRHSQDGDGEDHDHEEHDSATTTMTTMTTTTAMTTLSGTLSPSLPQLMSPLDKPMHPLDICPEAELNASNESPLGQETIHGEDKGAHTLGYALQVVDEVERSSAQA